MCLGQYQECSSKKWAHLHTYIHIYNKFNYKWMSAEIFHMQKKSRINFKAIFNNVYNAACCNL